MIKRITDVFFNFASRKALVVFLHGYRGDKDELSFLRTVIKERGYSFLSFTFGERDASGAIVSIKGFDREVVRTIEPFLKQRHYSRVYLIGYSLGAALAVSLATLVPCHGLVLISVFDDRKKLLHARGIHLSPGENISPVSLVGKLRGLPMVFIHGSADKSVNCDRAMKVYKENFLHSVFISLPVGHYFNDLGARKKLISAVDMSFLFL